MILVLADRDPASQLAGGRGHREGHIAIRWQLSDGNLPIPDTGRRGRRGPAVTGLPAVRADGRATARRDQTASFATRFLRRPR